MITSFVSSVLPGLCDTVVVVVVRDLRDLDERLDGDAPFFVLAGDRLFDRVRDRLLERDPDDLLFVFFV